MGSEIYDVLEYLKYIGQFKLLTPKQEKKLFLKFKNGDLDARKKLIEHNLRLVIPIAKKLSSDSISLADAIQEGNVGLINAVDRFNVNMGVKFSTYAYTSIDRSIKRAIEETGHLIRLSSYKHTEINKVNSAKVLLTKVLEREPTIEEISLKTGYSIKKVEDILKTAINYSLISLDKTVDDISLLDIIPNKNIPSTEEEVINNIDSHLDISCYALTPKEKLYFILWSGIEDGITKTFAEVGNLTGTSRANVSQHVKSAQAKIKKKLMNQDNK